MGNFVAVGKASELADGAMKLVAVDGRQLLLARVGHSYFVADNRCPHMGGNLSQGKLDGTVVTCPVHHSRFDLTDGRVARWTDKTGLTLTAIKLFKPPRPLKVYTVRVEGDAIMAEI